MFPHSPRDCRRKRIIVFVFFIIFDISISFHTHNQSHSHIYILFASYLAIRSKWYFVCVIRIYRMSVYLMVQWHWYDLNRTKNLTRRKIQRNLFIHKTYFARHSIFVLRALNITYIYRSNRKYLYMKQNLRKKICYVIPTLYNHLNPTGIVRNWTLYDCWIRKTESAIVRRFLL